MITFLILLFLGSSLSSIVTERFLIPECNYIPPGNESCYYQTTYDTLKCSSSKPCSRLFLYFGGGEEEVQTGKYDGIMKWWAKQSYVTMASQSFNTSDEAGKYPYFMEYDRITFMVNQTRNYYLSNGLWTGEYLIIGGISHGASAPPISIANRAGFHNQPAIWTGSISTAFVLFDGISNTAMWDNWLGQYSVLPEAICWSMHYRTVARYGDGGPLEHSCRNKKCFCSDPPSAGAWINDTIQLDSTDPKSPYTCYNLSLPSGILYWFIASCSGEGHNPCSPLGNVVPDSEQEALYNSLLSCDNVVANYYRNATTGHSLCGSRNYGANVANEWLLSIWPNF